MLQQKTISENRLFNYSLDSVHENFNLKQKKEFEIYFSNSSLYNLQNV